MKCKLLAILFFLTFSFTNTVEAGLFISENDLHLEPFKEGVICFGVWTGAPGTTHHTIEVSENLAPYVESISPTEFDIYQVDCPQDSAERRNCIRKFCNEDNTNFCRKVCINFKGPFYASFDTSEQVIQGSVKDIGYYLNAQTVVPQDITVYYRPYNLWIIILAVAVGVVLIAVLAYLKYLKNAVPQNSNLRDE